MLMTQKFSFEGNTTTFCLYKEGGWGNALKIGIIIKKKKKSTSLVKPRYPFISFNSL